MKKAKRLVAMLAAAVMCLSMLAACGGNNGNAGNTGNSGNSGNSGDGDSTVEPMVLNLGNVFNEGSVLNQVCEKFTEDLNNSGLFEVTYYNNSGLGTSVELLEMILADEPVLATLSGSDLGDAIQLYELAVTMAPFLYDDVTEVAAITGSDWWADLVAQAAEKNVHIIPGDFMSGERYFFTNTKVVEPEDLHGLKLRVPTNTHYINCMEAFGATPTPIAVSEMYTSIAQKTVDGCEFPLVDGYGRQLYEVCHYIASTSYMCEFLMPMMSENVWNSMSAEQQETLVSCAAAAAEYGFEIYEEQSQEYRDKFVEAGCEFVDIDVEAFKACVPTYYELNTDWPEDMYETVTGLVNDYRSQQ